MNKSQNLAIGVRFGEQAPFCYGLLDNEAFYSFEAQAGRPAVVILAGSLPPLSLAALVSAFQARADAFRPFEADVILAIDAAAKESGTAFSSAAEGPKQVYCPAEFFERCGFRSMAPWIFVVDRSLRVCGAIDPRTLGDPVASTLDLLSALAVEQPRDIHLPAPVLSVPRIFSRSFCAELIGHFDKEPRTQGGMASIDQNGRPVHKIDHSKKHRDDCVLNAGEPIRDHVIDALSRIVLPEIKKAYQFDVGFMDRLLIARYDHTGGYFRRHRDNVAAKVSFRQFAISINLNTEDYEGGHLVFPEFNAHRYRPETGGGLVFSASLLHEAMPVLSGCRYVLLTFLHNAEAERRRIGLMQDDIVQAA